MLGWVRKQVRNLDNFILSSFQLRVPMSMGVGVRPRNPKMRISNDPNPHDLQMSNVSFSQLCRKQWYIFFSRTWFPNITHQHLYDSTSYASAPTSLIIFCQNPFYNEPRNIIPFKQMDQNDTFVSHPRDRRSKNFPFKQMDWNNTFVSHPHNLNSKDFCLSVEWFAFFFFFWMLCFFYTYSNRKGFST